MRKISGIARYTFIEIFRNRVSYVLLLFAGVMILSTCLLGSLGGEQRNRMMIDLGLSGIETLSLIIAIFAATTLILQEMDSKTLYLILARPVARYQFLLGRFMGLMAIITSAYLLMAGGHWLLLKVVRVGVEFQYLLSLYYSWQKILLITAVAMAFSLFSTSTISAVAFTLFFWIMGHFSSEILYLAQKTSQPALVLLCKTFYYLAPNFSVMNLRDFNPQQAGTGWLWPAVGYGVTYTVVCLMVASLLFRKKEF